MARQITTPPFKLFNNSPIDTRDELDLKLEACFTVVKGLLSNATCERDTHDILMNQALKGKNENEDVCLGLLAMILTDRQSSQKAAHDLFLITRDNMNCVLMKFSVILNEKFLKISDTARGQAVWFANELVKTNVMGCEGHIHSLLKQIVGGDTSQKNTWLAGSVLDILIANKQWLDKSTFLMQMAVFTYLRILQDHHHNEFTHLRQKEVTFCITLLRERWNDCKLIGRDLVRLLIGVGRIPEFEAFWSDLIHNPQTLAPNFTGLSILVQTRTSKKFLTGRITQDMENKIGFLLMKVKLGQQKRYQDWFQKQYLSNADSQSLRADLVRYICGCVHPPNEILCSDVIPRWAVIGWILSTCTSRIASSNCYLSLFWDWLFYHPEKNSVMDIEPGVLVMFHSLRSHPAITTTLLDFLCRSIVSFHPPMQQFLHQSICLAFRTILAKRVLQSLSPLFDNPKFDNDLRGLLHATFAEFCHVDDGKDGVPPPLPPDHDGVQPPLPDKQIDSSDILLSEPMVIEDDSDSENNGLKSGNNDHYSQNKDSEESSDNLAIFSDDDESNDKVNNVEIKPFIWRDSPTSRIKDITSFMESLDETLQSLVKQLQTQSDTEEKCERVEDVVDHILSLEEFDTDVSVPLATCLVEIFSDHFGNSILNNSGTNTREYLEGCIEKPLYVIFRKLCQAGNEEDAFGILVSLLSEMYQIESQLGFHLLFFLAVRKVCLNEDNWSVYESFSQCTQLADMYNCLMMDMKHCQDYDEEMLIFLVPFIYQKFPEHCIGNSSLLNIIVNVMDAIQLQNMQYRVMCGELIMMTKESILNVLIASLDWETFDQYCTWDLLAAHDLPTDSYIAVVNKLHHEKHAEALSKLLIILKSKKPTSGMVKYIMARSISNTDKFTLSLLHHWAVTFEKDLADHISTWLCKSKSRNTPPRTGLRQSVRSSQSALSQLVQPTTTQMLGHMNKLRQSNLPKSCEIFSQDAIIAGLMQVQQNCDEIDKSNFSELFSLVANDSDNDTKNVKQMRTTRRKLKSSYKRSLSSSAMSNRNKIDSDSSSDSDSDDFITKTSKKRRKRHNNSSSDSS